MDSNKKNTKNMVKKSVILDIYKMRFAVYNDIRLFFTARQVMTQ